MVLEESNINSILEFFINLTANDDYLISMYGLLSMSKTLPLAYKCIQYSDAIYVDLLKDKIKELLSLVYGPFRFQDGFILIFF